MSLSYTLMSREAIASFLKSNSIELKGSLEEQAAKKVDELLKLTEGCTREKAIKLKVKMQAQQKGRAGYAVTEGEFPKTSVSVLDKKSDQVDDRDILNPDDPRVIDFNKCHQLDFLHYLLYFFIYSYYSLANNPEKRSKTKQKLQVTGENNLLAIHVYEIWMILNAYLIRKKYSEIIREMNEDKADKIGPADEEKMRSFISSILKEIMEGSEAEFEYCIPAGSPTHAVYLILVYTQPLGNLTIRVDNPSREKPILFNCGDIREEKTRSQVIQYLTEICLNMKMGRSLDAIKIINNEALVEKKFPFEKIKDKDANYPPRPAQTGPNCVWHGFGKGQWYRLYRIAGSSEDSVYNWLFKKTEQFHVALTDPPSLFEEHFRMRAKLYLPLFQSKNLIENILGEYYISQDRLGNPLTDKFLSLAEGHYVQLMIVKEEKEQREKEKKLEVLDRRARDECISSWEDIHKPEKLIELETLFEREESEITDPKKLLILGRAGIGKSTLCQYIAWRWSQGKLWNDRFDAVFLIPLRELVNYSGDSSYKAILLWLIRKCWHQDRYEELSEKDILDYFKSHKGKILFLLDGFDEVAHLKGKNTPAGKALDTLLSEEQWIVTSRPDYIQLLLKNPKYKIDRCLENIGFNEEHIEKYIYHFFVCHEAPEQSKPLLTYLKEDCNIRGIALVPINLSLLCGIWYQAFQKGNLQSLKEIQSMTGLYQRMVDELLNRYIEKHKTQEEALMMSEPEEENQTREIQTFLSHLAFRAMQKPERALILDAKLMNEVFKATCEAKEEKLCSAISSSGREKKKEQPDAEAFFKMIREVGFLKATGESLDKKESEKNYYFLHLTFQEYFAAAFLAESFSLEKSSKQYQEAVACLYYHKYDSYYQMVWLFVAGLTKATFKEDPKTLAFWEAFNEEPYDLLGNREMELASQLLREAECDYPWLPCQQARIDNIETYIKAYIKAKKTDLDLTIYLSNIPRVIAKKIFSECLLEFKKTKPKEGSFSFLMLVKVIKILLVFAPHANEEEVNQAFLRCVDFIKKVKNIEETTYMLIAGALNVLAPRVREKEASQAFLEYVAELQETKLQKETERVVKRVYTREVLKALASRMQKEQASQAFLKCVALLQRTEIEKNAQEGVADTLNVLAYRVRKEKVSETFLNSVTLLQEAEIKPDIREYARAKIIEALQTLAFRMQKEEVNQEFLRYVDILQKAKTGENAKVQVAIALALKALAPFIEKEEVSQAFLKSMALLQEAKIEENAQQVVVLAIEELASGVREEEVSQAFLHNVSLLQTDKIEENAKTAVKDVLMVLAPFVCEKEVSLAFCKCMTLLQEAKIKGGAQEGIANAVKVLALRIREEEVSEVFLKSAALFQEDKIEENAQWAVASTLEEMAPRVRKEEASQAFLSCMTFLQKAKIEKSAQEAVASALEELASHVQEEKVSEAFFSCVTLFQEAKIEKNAQEIVGSAFQELAARMQEEEVSQEFLRCATLLQEAKIDENAQKALALALKVLAPSVQEKEVSRAFLQSMALLQKAKIGKNAQEMVGSALEELAPRMQEEEVSQAFFSCVAFLTEAKIEKNAQEAVASVFDELAPRVREKEAMQAFLKTVALLQEAKIGENAQEMVALALEGLAPHLRKKESSQAFVMSLDLLRKSKIKGDAQEAVELALKALAPFVSEEEVSQAFLKNVDLLQKLKIKKDAQEGVASTLKAFAPFVKEERISQAFSEGVALLQKGKIEWDAQAKVASVLISLAIRMPQNEKTSLFYEKINILLSIFSSMEFGLPAEIGDIQFFAELLKNALRYRCKQTLITLFEYSQKSKSLALIYSPKNNTLFIQQQGYRALPISRKGLAVDSLGLLMKTFKEEAMKFGLPTSPYNASLALVSASKKRKKNMKKIKGIPGMTMSFTKNSIQIIGPLARSVVKGLFLPLLGHRKRESLSSQVSEAPIASAPKKKKRKKEKLTGNPVGGSTQVIAKSLQAKMEHKKFKRKRKAGSSATPDAKNMLSQAREAKQEQDTLSSLIHLKKQESGKLLSKSGSTLFSSSASAQQATLAREQQHDLNLSSRHKPGRGSRHIFEAEGVLREQIGGKRQRTNR